MRLLGLASLASFLQPPAFKLEILLDDAKEQVFTQVFYQAANTSICILQVLLLLGLWKLQTQGGMVET